MRDHHNAVQHRAYDERPQSDIVDTADYYECVANTSPGSTSSTSSSTISISKPDNETP